MDTASMGMEEEDTGDSEEELTFLAIAVFQKRQYDNKMGLH
jgi:hypothetical protein